jgi:hypothetical protein
MQDEGRGPLEGSNPRDVILFTPLCKQII